MKEKFYITTPIYYPNDIPHIGHAYTTIVADVISRWNKLLGKEVFFLTGTDDHGKKILETAEKTGLSPKKFVDNLIPKFKEAWKKLDIEYDRFIRTTDKDHEKVVQKMLQKSYDNKDIYLGEYEGLYCTGCEAYYTEKDLVDGCCPIHKKKIEKIKEKSYFFKLSKYQKKLLELYIKNPEFILPKKRKKEIINRVKEGLRDISISRTSFDWGVQLPFDKKHVAYVWFDALFNYYSATLNTKNKNFWPPDIHLIAKDINWFHTVYWPAFLMSAGLELPKKVFVHGYWTFDGDKISKSVGKIINIDELISLTNNPDSARYFLCRAVPLGEDGDFSGKALIERHNNELADKLGNLVSRVSTLAEKHGIKKTDYAHPNFEKTYNKLKKHFENYELDKALNEIFAYIDWLNEYAQSNKPWKTRDKGVIYNLASGIKKITILLSPFIPKTAKKIAKIFNFKIDLEELNKPLKISKIKKAQVLFKKIEIPQKTSPSENKKTNTKQKIKITEKMIEENKIPYEDFAKLDLRVGKILKAIDHPNADKLYVLTVDLAEPNPRTIVAGIKSNYTKEELKNKQAIFVANLEPAKIRNIESNGMILAASDKDKTKITILEPEKSIENGSKIS